MQKERGGSMNRVTYADIQAYLDAIAGHPSNKDDVESASHGRFWNVPYQQFVSGKVPYEDCNGSDIRIVDSDPGKCSLYQALIAPRGWCDLAQMPLKGPFITDPGYIATLKDGSTISGRDLAAGMVWWLTHNMPET
jgi:hypothetical protein